MSHVYKPPSLEVFFGDGDATDGSDSTYRARGVLDPVAGSVTIHPVAGLTGGTIVLPAPAVAKTRLVARLSDIDGGTGLDGYDICDVVGQVSDPKITHNEHTGAITLADGAHAASWACNREFVEGCINMLGEHGF